MEFCGLRPGEKLDERLAYPYEELVPTKHPLIKRVYTKPGAPVEQRLQRPLRVGRCKSSSGSLSSTETGSELIEALAATVLDYVPMPSSIGAVPAPARVMV